MIIVQTPLRISFLGGGTDFDDHYLKNDGAVLSTAINKGIYVIIKERFDDLICVNYSKRESVDSVDNLEHELVREAIRITNTGNGIEITTLADIPSEGTGLGSSSAVTVGLLHALYAYQGHIATSEMLAEQACNIEIDILNKPIGRQDQYISAYGNMRFITFSRDGINVETINLPRESKRKLNYSLLLFYTGISRKASSVLLEQKVNMGNNGNNLSELMKLAYQAKEVLIQGELDYFGEIMHKGWELKKELASKISNAEINDMYKTARKAGAIGGKITGAGGGGFLLLYCSPGKTEDVRSALHGLRELPFRFQEDGSRVIFNYRSAE